MKTLKIINIVCITITIFSLLFWLSMEETNAYKLNSYRGIPVTHDDGICQGYKACYIWNNERKDTINMEEYFHKTDYMGKVSHEFGHPFYSYILSDKQREIWDGIGSDKYDWWLEQNGVNVEAEFVSQYAEDSVGIGKYDEDFAEINRVVQNDTDYGIPSPKTKIGFKMHLVNKWRDDYGITKDYTIDYNW